MSAPEELFARAPVPASNLLVLLVALLATIAFVSLVVALVRRPLQAEAADEEDVQAGYQNLPSSAM